MEKLTQFVSKSFENNNNPSLTDHISYEVKISSISPLIKTEKEFITSDDIKKPINWLISDIEKSDNINIGVDLRLNPSRNSKSVYDSDDKCNKNSDTNCEVEKTTKWCKNNVNNLDSDNKDSDTCSDKCEKIYDKKDCNKDNNVSEQSEHKICKYLPKLKKPIHSR